MQRQPPVVKRYPARRRGLRWWQIGCGCLALSVGLCGAAFVAGIFILLPNMPEIAAQVAGMERQGSTDSIFAAAESNPQPTQVQLQNASRPQQVTVNLGDYGGSQVISPSSARADVAVGSDATGQQTAVVSFTESALMDLCRQQSAICNNSDPRFQNVRIDLRPGGAVIYADANVPTDYGFTIKQTAGVVLQLDSAQRRFVFAGVDLNGALFATPPGEFSGYVSEFEATGNNLLNQLTLDAGSGQMTLDSVQIDHSNITLILR
jgi:hypothetical protein